MVSVRSPLGQKSDFIVKKIVNRESGFRMKRGLQLSALLMGTCLALPAFADDTEDKQDPSLGLTPGSPEGTVLPGGMTPAFGQHPKDEQDWRFDFHGFFSMPFRVGIGTRTDPGPGQSKTTLHAPPVVPDDLDTFNPARVAGHEHFEMLRDVSRSDNWRERLSFVFRGPGWAYRRHAELAEVGSSGER